MGGQRDPCCRTSAEFYGPPMGPPVVHTGTMRPGPYSCTTYVVCRSPAAPVGRSLCFGSNTRTQFAGRPGPLWACECESVSCLAWLGFASDTFSRFRGVAHSARKVFVASAASPCPAPPTPTTGGNVLYQFAASSSGRVGDRGPAFVALEHERGMKLPC
jgi:hypothetical protein